MPKLFEWYWQTFDGEGLPVTMPALPRTNHFRWHGIYGLQLGPWFIGVIHGEAGAPYEPPASVTETRRAETHGGSVQEGTPR